MSVAEDRRSFLAAAFVILLAVVAFASGLQAQGKPATDGEHSPKPAAKAAAPDNFVESPIKSMDDFLVRIQSVKKRRIAETRLIQKIKIGGLAFLPTAEDLKTLQDAGMSRHVNDALDDWIDKHKPQPVKTRLDPVPAPPQTRAKNGILTVRCEPIDCTVTVADKAGIKITEGKLGALKLSPGTYQVRAAAPDYVPDEPQRFVQIQDNAESQVLFRFKSKVKILEESGPALFIGLIAALGGEAGLKEASSIHAVGTVTIYTHGSQASWGVTATLQAGKDGSFQLSRAGKKYDLSWVPDRGYTWKKNPADTKEASDVEDVLRLLYEFEPATLIQTLKGADLKMTGDPVMIQNPAERVLRAQGNPKTYVLVLDEASRPKELRIESTGLNNGLRVLYGDYVSEKNSWYPKFIQVLLPAAEQHGIEVRYAEVTSVPAETAPPGTKNRFGFGKK